MITVQNDDKKKVTENLQKEQRSGNYDFVSGPGPVVEIMWTIIDNIKEITRKRTTTLLFESIIYLRVNERIWDLYIACEVVIITRNARIDQRLNRYAKK